MSDSMMEFSQPGYGEYYLVLAETTQEALDKLKGFMLSHSSTSCKYQYPTWKDATLSNLPKGFTIAIKDCDVIVAEVS